MNLPEKYLERMKKMLGGEYDSFIAGYDQPRRRGLRVNTLKMSPDEFERIAPFPVKRIPWVKNGFFYPEDVFPADHPYYAAGLYYLQEPSAMTPADRLGAEPGERILDLCAAPGGKATELAARLQGQGLLVANDASNSRAKALLRNLELFGAANIMVTAEQPDRLAEVFPAYFDRIQVDAPCSGEGMFRKSPDVVDTWSPERVEYFAAQQKNILENAHSMLRPGGLLMYSTCTFSPEEDEQMIAWFVTKYPDMHIQEITPWYEGFSHGMPELAGDMPDLTKCVRIWPHRMPGEGHFMCLLKKDADISPEDYTGQKIASGSREISEITGERRTRMPEKYGNIGRKNKKKNRKKNNFVKTSNNGMTEEQEELLAEFMNGCSGETFQRRNDSGKCGFQIEKHGERAYAVRPLPAGAGRLNFLRNGGYIGEWKKNRFEPSQPFALTLSADTWKNSLCMAAGDERIAKYLKGETIEVREGEQLVNGWVLVCVEKFSLGWGKYSNGIIKNKLLGSWRR